MFRINSYALTAHKARFEKMKSNLPEAHAAAHTEGLHYLHSKMTEAADAAGWDPEGVQVFHDKHGSYIGITDDEKGDKVADAEFGTPEEMAQPVLRKAARLHYDEASYVYQDGMRRRLGI